MGPNVNTLVMNHKQALEEFAPGIEINAIALLDLVIIFHEVWSLMEITNICTFFAIVPLPIVGNGTFCPTLFLPFFAHSQRLL